MKFCFLFFVFFIYNVRLFSQELNYKVNNITGFLDISNGLIGISIPWKKAVEKKIYNLAPIQSIIYPNNQYSDNTPNYLKTGIELFREGVSPYSFNVSILKQTSSELSIQLLYMFNKPKFWHYMGNNYKGGEAGSGYYKCILNIRKSKKSIEIIEDTNYDIYYRFKISEGLMPTKARYRGWSSPNVQSGYESIGVPYRNENQRPYPMDATVDLNFQTITEYAQLSLWEPAGGEQSTGRYWYFYNSSAAKDFYLGMFQGKPSNLIGSLMSGPNLVTYPIDDKDVKSTMAEIKVTISRRTPDNSFYPRKRISWNLYVGKFSEIAAPTNDQEIGKEMNAHAGLGSRIKHMADKPVLINKNFYNGSIYRPVSEIQQMIRQIKNDYKYYTKLIYLEGDLTNLWNAWRHKDSVKPVVARMLQFKKKLVDNYINKDGTFNKDTRYWIGVRNFRIIALTISGLFADKSNSFSAYEKSEMEKLIGLMARILWDEDNVPVLDSAGVNHGPANMIYLYRVTGRYFFALLLSNDPEFSIRAKTIRQDMEREINKAIYPNGASFSNPHYSQTGMDAVWLTLLQLKQSGVGDLFNNPKIKKYCNFLITLLTPKSVRFNNNRKLICFGDGSEESAGSFGLLASGMKNIDLKLSGLLLSIFYNGPEAAVFMVGATLAIDYLHYRPIQPIQFTNANYNGYLSHFRSAANLNTESAAWILNGKLLYDHRKDDSGEFAIYALGAPLSLCLSSFYNPWIASAKMKSCIMPYYKFEDWNAENQPMMNMPQYPSTWGDCNMIEFASLPSLSWSYIQAASNDSSIWQRKFYQIKINDSMVLYGIQDSTQKEYVFTLPLMTIGEIVTPRGNISTTRRVWDAYGKQELPTSTSVHKINAGWNKFSFSGQKWVLHKSEGINCDIFTHSKTAAQFCMTEWTTNWQNDREINDYKLSNKSNYEETQQYFRIKNNAPLFTLLVPSLKNNTYYKSVSYGDQSIILQSDHEYVTISPTWYTIKKKNETRYVTLSLTPTAFGKSSPSLSGGLMEVVDYEKNINIYVHGKAGTRTITFPFAVQMLSPVANVTLKKYNDSTIISIKYNNNNLEQPLGNENAQLYKFVKS